MLNAKLLNARVNPRQAVQVVRLVNRNEGAALILCLPPEFIERLEFLIAEPDVVLCRP